MIKLIVFVCISFFANAAFAFTLKPFQALTPGVRPLGHPNPVLLFANDNDEISQQVDEKKDENVEWGVSYIGGDPCGSKYNTDPFDASAKITKPGMPDSMKARIAAKAEERLRQSQEASKENHTNK